MIRNLTVTATLLVTIAAATLLFYLFQHQLSAMWLDVTLRPEVRQALQESLADQKKLYVADRQHAAAYRERFERTRKLLARIEVLDLSRREMALRYELLLVGVFAVTLLFTGAISAVRHRRNERRLATLQTALQALSRGEAGVRIGDARRDVIGRIGRMIEETSDVVAGQRRRLEYLEHLGSWQEAARRHAHEIRTPLTAAHLEVERLIAQSRNGAPAAEMERTRDSIYEELERLSRFTKQFSSFATVGQPQLRDETLAAIADEFTRTFASAWPTLALRVDARDGAVHARVLADRDMLRQVLANLCSNSAAAGAHAVTFRIEETALDVADDGQGIAANVRTRIFEPYVTTRRVGEGMGLGLAISRKILLDHGGDLELVGSSPAGTTFRLTFQRAEEVPA